MSKVGFTGLPPLQESGTVHGHHNPSPFPLPQNLQVHPTSSNPNPSTTGSSAKQQNYGLHHLETNWPGETGNGHHLDVIPGMTLFQILSLSLQQKKNQHHQPKTIVIPLFQRRYCWTPI